MIVVVLSFDVLPLVALECFGGRQSTPGFNQVAARSVVFDQHFAAGPAPRDAMIPWWRGQFPWIDAGDAPSLVATLEAAGVQTFGLFERESQVVPDEAGFGELTIANSHKELLSFARDCLDRCALKSTHSLVWIHARGLVRPFDFHREIDGESAAEEAFWDAELAALDDVVQEVFTLTEGLPQTQGVFVVTAASGANDVATPRLSESALHVPLLVKSLQPLQLRQLALTQHVDLPQLLAGCYPFVEHDFRLDGVDWTWENLLSDQRQSARTSLHFGCNGEWGLRDTAWFVRVASTEDSSLQGFELFKKPSDRWEENDVSRAYPEEVEDMVRRLQETRGLLFESSDPV